MNKTACSFLSLSNLPVRTSAREIGRLVDVYVKDSTGRIEGILIETNTILKRHRLLEMRDINDINDNEIIVNDRYELKKSRDGSLKSYQKELNQKAVITDEGNHLGRIKEGYFDFEAGQLVEFELGNGFADDLILGRKKLIPGNSVSIGKKTVTVLSNDMTIKSKNRSNRSKILEGG